MLKGVGVGMRGGCGRDCGGGEVLDEGVEGYRSTHQGTNIRMNVSELMVMFLGGVGGRCQERRVSGREEIT